MLNDIYHEKDDAWVVKLSNGIAVLKIRYVSPTNVKLMSLKCLNTVHVLTWFI